MDTHKNKIQSAKLKFNIVGVIALAVGILMPLFLLLDWVVVAVLGSLTGFAVSVNTFKAKGYYLQSIADSQDN